MSYLDNMLTPNERILQTARRHPIYVVRQTALLLIGALILWGLAVVAMVALSSVGGIAIDLILGVILLVGSLVPLAIAGYRFLDWWNEKYVVTNHRVVQIEGLVNRRTFETALEQVNEVQMTQGMLGRLFNYGTIDILTGSDLGVNHIDGVANPFEFKRALQEAKLSFGRWDATVERQVTQSAGPVSGVPFHEQATSQFEPVSDGPTDSARMVVALTELRNAGVITQAEYDEKLRKLMQGQPTAQPWDSG